MTCTRNPDFQKKNRPNRFFALVEYVTECIKNLAPPRIPINTCDFCNYYFLVDTWLLSPHYVNMVSDSLLKELTILSGFIFKFETSRGQSCHALKNSKLNENKYECNLEES